MISTLLSILISSTGPCENALHQVTSARSFEDSKDRAREQAKKLNLIQIDYLFANNLSVLTLDQQMSWLQLWKEIKEARK